MSRRIADAALVAALFVLPASAYAQSGAATGAVTGAVTGGVVGGPVGAAVGGAAGAIAGGIADDQRPKFRTYVTSANRPSYAYKEKVVVGAKLPASGVTYYDVPADYKVTKYKYTVVNERPVLVDPGSHTIVQVIE
jgi:uncharacterized protein YcfJ